MRCPRASGNPCPACCLVRLQREYDETLLSSDDARLRWIRVRDALYQHGERHFGGNEDWWSMFEAFENVAIRLVRPRETES